MPEYTAAHNGSGEHRGVRSNVITRREAALGIGKGVSLLAAPYSIGCAGKDYSDPEKPNVFIAIADDWSWLHSGMEKYPAIRTPVFDRCAREGAYFTHAFASSPSCTPSRAALLTGRHFWELEQGANLWGTLPAKFRVFPDILEREGYQIGFCEKGWGPGSVKAGGRKRNPAGPRYANFGHFLSVRPANTPFYFWFGSRDPHRYYGPRARISRKPDFDKVDIPPFLPDVKPVRRDMGNYLFEVQRFDREIGQVLRLLERRGELDKTIVIITSDNGMPFPRCKANCYDWGVRVPMAVRWPGVIRAGTVVDDPVSLCDLAPSLLQKCATRSEMPLMSGDSLWPLVVPGRSSTAGRRYAFLGRERHTLAQGDTQEGYPVRAVRSGDYLYIRNFKPQRFPAGTPPAYLDCDSSPTKRYIIKNKDNPSVEPMFRYAFAKRAPEELYDVKNDPGQVNNVAGDEKYAGIKNELWTVLKDELVRTGDPRIRGDGDVFEEYAFHTLKRIHQ
ncbi:MAG: sulfatase-like hydrolase/transferase [Chitinivibrionales bacterium]|nr:sulfatase-like hydrolase/transferase [Chitinivibrionales bacterium]